MGGQDAGRPERAVEVDQGVGVDDQRHVVVERLLERAGRAVAAAGRRPPRPAPARRRRPRGASGARVATAASPTYRTMPHSPLAAPATLSRPRRGSRVEPARMPTTPREYFWASGSGGAAAPRRRRAGAPRPARGGRSRPMSTRCTAPHAAARGVDQVGDLVGAEGDGDVGRDVRPVELAGVDVDARRGVHGDERDSGDRCQGLLGLGSQPRATADPDDAVDRDVGRARSSAARPRPGRRPVAGRPGPSRCGAFGRAATPRPAAAPGQHRAGVERVAAVVAGADQQHHPSPVRRTQQVDHGVRQPGRRALHQRPLRQRRHQLRLGRPDLLHRVRPPHALQP